MRSRVVNATLWAATFVMLTVPALAAALAGGSTGGGGGGGGGGGFSGGGGSGSGGGEISTEGVILIVVIGGGIFVATSAPAYLVVRKRKRRAARMAREARIADLDDGYWDPQVLRDRVHECFFPIQNTWEERDVEGSRPYVSEALLERHRLQLEGYEAQNRVNRIEDLSLDEVEIIRIHNVADDHQDRFVAYIGCRARDWMENTETGAVVNGNKKSVTKFQQFWTFTRDDGHGWVLDEIQQYKEGEYHLSEPAVNVDGLGPSRPPSPSSDAPDPGRAEPAQP